MRTIPSELLNKVRKKWQGTAENANPGMKAYLSRGLINELFQVYTIQENENVEAVDVTVSRPETKADPSKVYAICLNDGVASVKSKPLPYDELVPWISEFQVSSGVADAAIEFNGYWKYNFDENRFNFITEEYPWIFYVVSGTLKAQYWQDTALTLSTDVSKVAAIRGWVPANGERSNDQGLIVAYVKTDGHVYYRNYCIQEDEQVLWESEKQITEFTDTVSNLSLFRTNDFRIGFAAEISGELHWIVTERNYAGMSVLPEFVTGDVVSLTATTTPVQYIENDNTEEYVTGDVTILGACLGDGTANAVEVVETGFIDEYQMYIRFNYPLELIRGTLTEHFEITNISNTVTNVVIDSEDSTQLIITVAEELITYISVTVAYDGLAIMRAVVTDMWREYMLTADEWTISGQPPEAYEYVTGDVNSVSASITMVNYVEHDSTEEYVTGDVNSLTATITQVGYDPL